MLRSSYVNLQARRPNRDANTPAQAAKLKSRLLASTSGNISTKVDEAKTSFLKQAKERQNGIGLPCHHRLAIHRLTA